jgi:hypothetical protein
MERDGLAWEGGEERRIGTMLLFMDIHRNVEGLTAEA